MIKLEQLAGVVLCGGKSRRMGKEKYRLVVLGETLLQRICRIVQPEVSRILIVAAVDQQIPQSESNIEVLRDEIRDAGPLAGIAQALTYLQTTEDAPAAAFVTSCDVPLLKPELIRLLRNQLTEEFDAVVVRDSNFAYPLCAIYRIAAAATAARLITSGQHRAAALSENLRTSWLPLDAIRTVDQNLDSLLNCNTPEDYEHVKQALL
ncbi:MAG: molybdenum cofactor guanylyltransferase [Planctomycetota bacterium]|jgi:molybdopterin-guanine dinucleotide biosynthesis protein A|nr:MAG: molybdenum cofactor guanylyltransferase [Planctomycetota bacterium]